MTPEELRELIRQPEGIKLDFKREYKLSAIPPAGTDKQMWTAFVRGQWDEFIKDILSLTNGNAETAWETGYLIIGVGDRQLIDGSRQLYNTISLLLSSQEIMAKVNSSCAPPIPDIKCEQVLLDEKNISVIAISPSPHVHETTRQLQTTKGEFDQKGTLRFSKPGETYTARTAFIRRGEDTHPATDDEREALKAEKYARYITKKPDPMLEEVLNRVTEIHKVMVPAETYKPVPSKQTQSTLSDEEDWIQGDLVYELKLPKELSEENAESVKVTLSEWRFVTTSSTSTAVTFANGIIGLGQTDGVTFNLSPVNAIDNCSVDCDILIVADGDEQSNWAGIRVRGFDFAYDFRLGYLVYLRRSGQVELYGPEGILDGFDRIAVPDTNIRWTNLRVDVLESQIRVYVNGIRHITQMDKTFGGKGRVYLDTFGTHSQFRNFRVYELKCYV